MFTARYGLGISRILHFNVSLQMFKHVTGCMFVLARFQQTAAADNSPSISTKFAFMENVPAAFVFRFPDAPRYLQLTTQTLHQLPTSPLLSDTS